MLNVSRDHIYITIIESPLYWLSAETPQLFKKNPRWEDYRGHL